MIIVGCDFHPSYQQIAFVDTKCGEVGMRDLQFVIGTAPSTA